MFRHALTLAAALTLTLALLGSAALAMDTDDVVRLAKAGVGEDVIIAQMQAAKARFVLTADDIVRMKKEGVSDAVLKAMIQSAKPAPEPAQAPEEPRPAPQPAPAPAAAPASNPVQVIEQPSTTQIIERHYYVQPAPPPVQEVIYVPAPRPPCPVYVRPVRYPSYYHHSHCDPHVGLGVRVNTGHVSIGFRL